VDLVTGATGSPSPWLVDVKLVKVSLFVAEFRNADRLLREHRFLKVAVKAQGIRLDIERYVVGSRVCFYQQGRSRGGMGVMAGGALTVADRAVVLWVLFEQAGQVRHDAAVAGAERFVVARKTEIFLDIGQQSGADAAMTGMTGMARIASGQRAVDQRRGLDLRAEVVVLVA